MRRGRSWRVRDSQSDRVPLRRDTPPSEPAATGYPGDGVASAQQIAPRQDRRLKNFGVRLRKPSVYSNWLRCGHRAGRRTVEIGGDPEGVDARTTMRVTAARLDSLPKNDSRKFGQTAAD